jgi:hypothetical protein
VAAEAVDPEATPEPRPERQATSARSSCRSKLAKGLHDLATIHSAAARPEEALAAAREAVKIYGPLADRFPGAFFRPLEEARVLARTARERSGCRPPISSSRPR